ncbi:uncharacterized protein LOC131241011 isoform X6 [Magnolia sinica]|uniref:uncharacterized protein LOC131241011 isoform X6 n=1 Tax=Magnolia sinica TaxID=86752 RepID=UPI00265B12D7|nr:uncharacterized protein LOC131241011 isoform X6 [Magnolia sinica]
MWVLLWMLAGATLVVLFIRRAAYVGCTQHVWCDSEVDMYEILQYPSSPASGPDHSSCLKSDWSACQVGNYVRNRCIMYALAKLCAGLNGSWKNMSFRVHAMSATQGNVATPKGISKLKHEPDHLVVLVHGILASPSDWTYVEAELKRRLGSNFLIYASSSNTYTKTFTGIDGAGRRLADEVMQVVRKTESLKRISFLAHSLGGLFARYAIAALYSSNAFGKPENPAGHINGNPEKSTNALKLGAIAGLEPINFITLATPHLGVRGKRQPPLRSLDGYKHVVDVEYCPPMSSEGPHFPPEAAKAKEAAQTAPSTQNTSEYHDIMEEEMIGGLQRLGWKKVDVSFHSSFWPFFAHNNIHVKSEWLHNAGTGVVDHVADSLKKQESSPAIAASL